MKIAVVIINFRTADLTIRCLDALAKEVGTRSDILAYVGDAESGDNSIEIISAHISEAGYDWAECFEIGHNGGFAFGNNFVLKAKVLPDPTVDYVYFLNPDAFVYPGAVQELSDFLKNNPNAGVAGSRLENPDGSLRAYAFRAPTPWREFFRGARFSLFERVVPSAPIVIMGLRETQEVSWVSGASFMMPRTVLEKVGLFDDEYFLYFEETDLMTRVRASGYSVWHVAESRVIHLAGQATGLTDTNINKRRIPSFWLQSRFKYFRDHYGRIGALFANLLYLLGDAVYRLHRVVRNRPVENPPQLWRSYLTDGFSLPTARR